MCLSFFRNTNQVFTEIHVLALVLYSTVLDTVQLDAMTTATQSLLTSRVRQSLTNTCVSCVQQSLVGALSLNLFDFKWLHCTCFFYCNVVNKPL